MIDKIHAFFNRGKKQVKWEENIFVPIVKTVDVHKGNRPTFNQTFENTLKK
jgi:hypothetical protein